MATDTDLTTTVRPEFRTPERIRADDEIAASVERYIVKDAATGWAVHEATDERRRLAAADPANAIAAGGLGVPFLWNGGVYRITRAEYRGGVVRVEASPHDPDFVAEVRRRIEAVPYRVLTFHQGHGYVCFPEDRDNYQDFVTPHGQPA
jgi:hypothetical protein